MTVTETPCYAALYEKQNFTYASNATPSKARNAPRIDSFGAIALLDSNTRRKWAEDAEGIFCATFLPSRLVIHGALPQTPRSPRGSRWGIKAPPPAALSVSAALRRQVAVLTRSVLAPMVPGLRSAAASVPALDPSNRPPAKLSFDSLRPRKGIRSIQ